MTDEKDSDMQAIDLCKLLVHTCDSTRIGATVATMLIFLTNNVKNKDDVYELISPVAYALRSCVTIAETKP